MSQLKEVLRQIIIAVVLYFFYKGPFGPLFKENLLWATLIIVSFFVWGMQLEKKINPKKKKVKISLEFILILFIWLLFRASLEEFTYRVFLWGILGKYIGIWWALIATNVVFSVFHAHQGWRGVLGSFIHGIIWGVVLYSFGIVPAIISHVSFNLGGYVNNMRIERVGKKKK